MSVGAAIVESVAVLYGCLLLTFASVYALTLKETWVGPSEAEKKNTAASSHKQWSLEYDADPLLAHDFLSLPDGLQLHYIKTRPELRKRPARHLVIFIHGFPDSCHLFRKVLESDLSADAQFVSLDLPGCGGSDSLPKYSSDLVLNAVVDAIVLLKRQYLTRDGMKCILVAHDWGGVVGYRIAADTRGLFDRMITMNGVYATSVEADIRLRFSQASDAWSQWSKKSPFGATSDKLGPVWSQLSKSHYTFLLQLTFQWPKAMPSVAAALLRYVHRNGSHKFASSIPEESLAACLTSSYGPSPAELASGSTKDGLTYGPTVHERAKTTPSGDWNQRFRLYREGLILEPWTLAEVHARHAVGTFKDESSEETSSTQPHRRLDVPASQRFKYPVTVLFGIDDEALDHRIVVDSLDDFFMRKEDGPNFGPSKIRKMAKCGHWSPMTEIGTATLIEELKPLITA